MLNQKGMTLPAMLAIIVFLIGSITALLTISYNRALIIERNIKSSEEFINTSRRIQAIQNIIARDEITDQTAITDLANYFNINYEQPSEAIHRFFLPLENVNRTVSGYLAANTTVVNTYDEVFQYTGTEDTFELSPMINATSMLAEYSYEFFENSFPDLVVVGDFSSFDSIVQYYRSITNDYYQLESPTYITNQVNPTINNHIFIDGNVNLNNKNLSIADGYLLVIDGNLTTNNNVTITGNMIVNGDYIVNGRNRQNRQFTGTFYVNGRSEIARDTQIGTSNRPSFFIVNGDVYLDNQVTIYGYFICNYFEGQQGQNFITGGVYAFDETSKINDQNLEPNETLSSEDLYDYGVTTTIIVESSSGETTFIYTEPRLE